MSWAEVGREKEIPGGPSSRQTWWVFFYLTLIYPCFLFPLQTPDQALEPHLSLSTPICRPIGHLVLGEPTTGHHLRPLHAYAATLFSQALGRWPPASGPCHPLSWSFPQGHKVHDISCCSLCSGSPSCPHHPYCHFGAQHHQSLLPPPHLTLVSFTPLGAAMQGKPLLALVPIITRKTLNQGPPLTNLALSFHLQT